MSEKLREFKSVVVVVVEDDLGLHVYNISQLHMRVISPPSAIFYGS